MGKHSVSEPTEETNSEPLFYLVPSAMIELNDGSEYPAIVALHPVVAATTNNLLVALGTVYGKEAWYFEPDELEALGKAYEKFQNSPALIIAQEQEQQVIDAEIVPE